MNNYTLSQITRQGLNPLQSQVYNKLLVNSNKTKVRQQVFNRKDFKKVLHYALSSISDALQELRKKGLIYYNKVTRSWVLRVVKQKVIDIYDNYVKLKMDWRSFISRVGGKVMVKLRWHNVKNNTDFIPEPNHLDPTNQIKVPYSAKPMRNIDYQLAKDKKRQSTMKGLPYYKGDR